jgi:hypothetical protein
MIYIDSLKKYNTNKFLNSFFGNTKYAHLISDKSLDELHSFANENSIPKFLFHKRKYCSHYDIPELFYNYVITKGAIFNSSKIKEEIKKTKITYF